MLELQRQRKVDEDQAKEAQRREQEEKLLAVEREMKEAELAAIAQAAKEAALLNLKDMQLRSEEENNNRNLQRLRDQHAKEEERLRAAAAELAPKA